MWYEELTEKIYKLNNIYQGVSIVNIMNECDIIGKNLYLTVKWIVEQFIITLTILSYSYK
jgi:hypothetical protein